MHDTKITNESSTKDERVQGTNDKTNTTLMTTAVVMMATKATANYTLIADFNSEVVTISGEESCYL